MWRFEIGYGSVKTKKRKRKNGKISFKKALKKIRKLKKKRALSEEEKNLREEKLKILEKESLTLENNQEKSVWIEQK